MTVSTLFYIIAILAIIGVICWVVMQAPIAPIFKTCIYAVCAIFCILWLLGAVTGHQLIVLHW